MRLNLDLESLHVETTEMQPEIAKSSFAAEGALMASILWNTQTEPIQADTRSSPCVA